MKTIDIAVKAKMSGYYLRDLDEALWYNHTGAAVVNGVVSASNLSKLEAVRRIIARQGFEIISETEREIQ